MNYSMFDLFYCIISRAVPDVKFARFRIPDVAGCCLPDSGTGFRIPDFGFRILYFGKLFACYILISNYVPVTMLDCATVVKEKAHATIPACRKENRKLNVFRFYSVLF